MSGCKYVYEGKVIGGNRIGRKIGFPTINIPVETNMPLPKFGVYAATVDVVYDGTGEHKTYSGIANLGVKPTVDLGSGSNPVGIEVFIFDFDEEVYDEKVIVSLMHFIRPEKKFDSFEDLTDQISEDVNTAKEYLKS